MIAFLKGTLAEKGMGVVILDVGGVGYEVSLSLNTYDALPTVGSPCQLLIHDHYREDAHLLFGFKTEAERELFRLLQTVSGIGAKTAISMLNGLSLRELRLAITQKDVKRLSAIQGIGRKTAERIAVELADKINPLDALSAQEGTGETALSSSMRDAVLALCALGQTQENAVALVRKAAAAAPAADTETLIKKALAR
ncbi:MAG: Holliday junction branch migration protein RuvA [Kiritimatiellaeota bacterium]|nr:Holliday junction branch migration protein RuvA [Kiritimatiellota bacterium]